MINSCKRPSAAKLSTNPLCLASTILAAWGIPALATSRIARIDAQPREWLRKARVYFWLGFIVVMLLPTRTVVGLRVSCDSLRNVSCLSLLQTIEHAEWLLIPLVRFMPALPIVAAMDHDIEHD